MQKRRNDVKARTTLLLALPDEYQLRFSKYKTAQELWAAILKTLGQNKATKKTKKNQLKQKYGNFKEEGKETLEQTFNRLQAIVSHLEFMDVEIEQYDLNQKFLTSLALEWLMYTIMWRNRSDLVTISLDDLYNHLKVYEPEVQKKPKSNSQNIAFISSAKTSSGKEEVNTASFSTASTQVSPASADVATASFSHGTIYAYIASQSNGSQKKTGKKITIQGTDVAGFNKLKVECFNCHKMGHFARDCRAPRSQDRGRREVYKEQTPKALMAIDRVGWDWSYMANEEENHALVAEEEAPIEFALIAKSSSKNVIFDNSLCSKACLSQVEARLVEFKNQEIKFCEKIRGLEVKVESKDNRTERLTKELEELKKEKEGLDSKLTSFQSASKYLDTLLGSQMSDKNKEGLRYSTIPPILLKPSISIESNSSDLQNSDSSVFEIGESSESIMSKPMIKFVKAIDSPTEVKISKVETIRKPCVKYAEIYRNTTKSPKNVIDDKGYWDSGCSRHMTGNISYLLDYEPYDGGFTWTFFLKTKDETSGILRNFITEIENLKELKGLGDEGYFIGYSMSSKAFRVFNNRTKRVEENLHVDFLENELIEKGVGPNWLFDIDTLTNSMNYVPVVAAGTTSTNFSGTKDAASQDVKKDVSSLRYISLPNWFHEAHLESSTSNAQDACNADAPESTENSNPTATSTNPLADMETLTVETLIPTVSSPILTACLDDSPEPSSDTRLISKRVTSQDDIPSLENILTLSNRFEDILGVSTNTGDTNGVEADLGNMENNISSSPTPTFRIHKDHPKSQIIGPVDTPSLVDCPKGVRPIGTKWVLKNKKDKRGIVIRNKSRLVAQGYTQEEGIDYEEVFAPIARIEAIRLFLAYASFMGFTVYHIDVKSAFLYGTIDKEVYMMQPPGFQDLEFPARVYKVEKAMYGLHQAPRAWYGTLSKYLLTDGFQRITIDQTLFIKKYRGDFILVQVSANTPMDKENPWGKDGTGKDVDLHLYGSVIGSLMYLTASRPDIMFAVYACARHQVTPKECHLYAVKRIFRYLKGHPKLGIWYPKDSPFELMAYSDSDYGGATQDKKSTIGGCQFLDRRLISWQCKK
nr:hypothetical protein [Tanacetum cinerariifolium]